MCATNTKDLKIGGYIYEIYYVIEMYVNKNMGIDGKFLKIKMLIQLHLNIIQKIIRIYQHGKFLIKVSFF